MAADEPFGATVRRLRRRSGLTQEELAERAGLSPRAVRALERGERRRPYPHTIRALAAALEASGQEVDLLEAEPRPALRRQVPPAALTPLVGRENELRRVSGQLVTDGRRLLTLTGPGGVGKTRLAVALAEQAAPAFPDGVVFVPLAEVREPGWWSPRSPAASACASPRPAASASSCAATCEGAACCCCSTTSSTCCRPRRTWRPCWRPRRGWPCSPPAGRRSASGASRCTRCRRWRSRRQWSSSWPGPARRRPARRRRTGRPRRRSAGAWTACRSPSSWRRPAPGSCRHSPCWPGSTRRSPSWPAAPATSPSGSARCG